MKNKFQEKKAKKSWGSHDPEIQNGECNTRRWLESTSWKSETALGHFQETTRLIIYYILSSYKKYLFSKLLIFIIYVETNICSKIYLHSWNCNSWIYNFFKKKILYTWLLAFTAIFFSLHFLKKFQVSKYVTGIY